MTVERYGLVTGAGKGLGREIALALADEIAGVAVHYHRDKESAEATAEAIKQKGKDSAALAAGLTEETAVAGLISEVERRFGRLDILVNNVGPILVKPWADLAASDWEKVFRTNLVGSFLCLKAALPGMKAKKWGRIINIGYSRAEQLAAFPNITAYAAAKTGLLILTRTAAASEAGSGVTINMVSPGLIEGGIMPKGYDVHGGAVGTFADVAGAVRYLISEEARAVTGTNLIVAGTWKM
jgi:3-oxoacyl-[acyl-carrier protein] reductase